MPDSKPGRGAVQGESGGVLLREDEKDGDSAVNKRGEGELCEPVGGGGPTVPEGKCVGGGVDWRKTHRPTRFRPFTSLLSPRVEHAWPDCYNGLSAKVLAG